MAKKSMTNASEERIEWNYTQTRAVSFHELDDALAIHPGACTTAAAIGYVYGSVAAPLPVNPTQYLPFIFGRRKVQDTSVLQRILPLVLSLHNRIAQSIMAGQSVDLLLPEYATSKEGLIRRVEDLHQLLAGFQQGIMLGLHRKKNVPTKFHLPFGLLTYAIFELNSLRNRYRRKTFTITDEEAAKKHLELDKLKTDAVQAMEKIVSLTQSRYLTPSDKVTRHELNL